MATNALNTPPSWFRVVALVTILWNAFGVFMYLHSVGMFGDPMADLSAAERAAAQSIPAAIKGAFAIGTFAGLLGSVGLALRKRWAWPLLLVSLLGLIVLEGWIVFLSGYLEAFGLVLPIAIVAVALLLAGLANHGRKQGWLA